METTYTWQIVGGGKTRMTLRNRGEPAGFSKSARTTEARVVSPWFRYFAAAIDWTAILLVFASSVPVTRTR